MSFLAIFGLVESLVLCTLFTPSYSIQPSPLLLLVSLDGWRYDLLNKTTTPHLWRLAESGVRFVYGVQSQYLTVTTPNHVSISTGLFQESHGIVGNQFYDPDLDQRYDLWNFSKTPGIVQQSLDQKWYTKGEPIWLTNERAGQGRRSASLDWPTGAAHFPGQPSKLELSRHWTAEGNLTIWKKDFDQVLKWFIGTEQLQPVNFVAWYIAQPDEVLHHYGFDSPELNGNLTALDNLFGYVMEQLESTGLKQKLNIIVTADHGHIQIENYHQVICLADYIGMNASEMHTGDLMLYIKNASLIQQVYSTLEKVIKEKKLGLQLFLKANFPEHYHYTNNKRVGDILVIIEPGWTLSLKCTSESLDQQWEGKKYSSSAHGQIPEDWRMRPLLFMSGPVFSTNCQITEIPQNVDLFPLMCRVLSVSCPPNNGSMAIVSKALRGFSLNTFLDGVSLPFNLHGARAIVILCSVLIPISVFACYMVLSLTSRKRSNSRDQGFKYSRIRNGSSNVGIPLRTTGQPVPSDLLANDSMSEEEIM